MAASPPLSSAELLARAERLAGESIAGIARALELPVPPDLKRHKGWVGHLVERALGASAGSLPVPDFQTLGIELKTLPVDAHGYPYESTFVCTITIAELLGDEWNQSRVCHKLTRVLWMPLDGDRQRVLSERRFGSPFLWSPSAEQMEALKFDWEELTGRVARYGVDAISGHIGQHLQIRPKAKNAAARRRGLDEDGGSAENMPRGFYLRPSFTGRILRSHFGLPERT